jgi:hypothetical protein
MNPFPVKGLGDTEATVPGEAKKNRLMQTAFFLFE